MFDNNCLNCGSKISKKSNFCSGCGFDLSKNYDSRDYGMLGRDDNGPLGELPMGLGSLLGNLMNEMNKQMSRAMGENMKGMNEEKQNNKVKRVKQSGISISISSSTNGQPKISIKKFGDANLGSSKEEFSQEIEEIIPSNKMSDDKAIRVSKLPKEEAKSKVRRIGEKLVYEIEVPGVKKLDDIIINKLEESIEIKAFSDKTSYWKNLPVTLPITKYKLSKEGILTIELTSEE
ncbi:MAG: zinc ribbon domain-containing protein [Nanoarchaeota archaeon]